MYSIDDIMNNEQPILTLVRQKKKVEHKVGYMYSRPNRLVQWQVVEYDTEKYRDPNLECKCIHCCLHLKKECDKTACHASERKDGKEIIVEGF